LSLLVSIMVPSTTLFRSQLGDGVPESREAHDLGIAIVGGEPTPGGVGLQTAHRAWPARLALVEIAGAERRDLVDHERDQRDIAIDRKSTRLNSSHVSISY